MPTDLAEFIKILLPALFGAGGAYAAIRSDIARLTERATVAAESAKEAHQRIDEILKGCKR